MISSYWGFLDQYGPNNQAGGRRRGVIHTNTLSPTLQADELRGGRPRTSGMHHSMYRGHPGPMNMGASTAGSVLLDPHHQPLPGAFQRRQHGFPHQQHPTSSLLEEDEYLTGAQTPQQYVSNLGEPFMSARYSATASGEEDRSDPQVAAGVLGLLDQFQRVQKTGAARGAVNI